MEIKRASEKGEKKERLSKQTRRRAFDIDPIITYGRDFVFEKQKGWTSFLGIGVQPFLTHFHLTGAKS
jgi:hypothetical protein